MNERLFRSGIHEQLTRTKLEELGNKVRKYGQEMVPPETRELLRQAPNPARERWIADFLVDPVDGDDLVLVDAKYALASHGGNHSIEMRALAAAMLESRSVHYVCAMLTEATGEWSDWKSIEARLVPRTWPCCPKCGDIYRRSTPEEALRDLPGYCPERQRSTTASQTPFFVIKRDNFSPSTDIFGITPQPRTPDTRAHRSIDDQHKWCRFEAGDLYCVNDPCANPAHRDAPAGYFPGSYTPM